MALVTLRLEGKRPIKTHLFQMKQKRRMNKKKEAPSLDLLARITQLAVARCEGTPYVNRRKCVSTGHC